MIAAGLRTERKAAPVKNVLLGQHNSRNLRPFGRRRTSRVRFNRLWSLRGCVLDAWQWLGARRRVDVDRPIPYVVVRYREISLEDWARA